MAQPSLTVSWITDSQRAQAGSMATGRTVGTRLTMMGLTVSVERPPLGEIASHSEQGK